MKKTGLIIGKLFPLLMLLYVHVEFLSFIITDTIIANTLIPVGFFEISLYSPSSLLFNLLCGQANQLIIPACIVSAFTKQKWSSYVLIGIMGVDIFLIIFFFLGHERLETTLSHSTLLMFTVIEGSLLASQIIRLICLRQKKKEDLIIAAPEQDSST